MKKIVILASIILFAMGCKKKEPQTYTTNEYMVEIMDSCEYIFYNYSYGFQHKGNCRFCIERRQKELDYLINKLKEE